MPATDLFRLYADLHPGQCFRWTRIFSGPTSLPCAPSIKAASISAVRFASSEKQPMLRLHLGSVMTSIWGPRIICSPTARYSSATTSPNFFIIAVSRAEVIPTWPSLLGHCEKYCVRLHVLRVLHHAWDRLRT